MTDKAQDMPTDEEWRDVVGYEGAYMVSNIGQIKSLISGRILVCHPDGDGYLHFKAHKNGVGKNYHIHSAVALAFIGERNGRMVNHKDGNNQNNRANNLEYVSNRENVTHGNLSRRAHIGSYFHSASGRWFSKIRYNGTVKYLGYFNTPEKASSAYLKYISDNRIENKYAKETRG